MKTFILGAVSAFALLTAGAAVAADSISNSTQTGTSNDATIEQVNSAGGAVSTVTQIGSGNQANVIQTGHDNTSSILQNQVNFGATTTPSNQAQSSQSGAFGLADIRQDGDSVAGIRQRSAADHENARILQIGQGNLATTDQEGHAEFAMVAQAGNNNIASVVQQGVGNGLESDGLILENRWNGLQSPFYEFNVSGIKIQAGEGAIIDVVGNNNDDTIVQGGAHDWAQIRLTTASDSSALIIQDDGTFNSVSVIRQTGDNHTAESHQYGGTSLSLITQSSRFDAAYVNQIGSNTSTVVQGPSGNFQTAHVDQNAPDNISDVEQFGGNFNDARVTQDTSGNVASVIQNGFGNHATVHQ